MLTQQELEDDLSAEIALAVHKYRQAFGKNRTFVMLEELQNEIGKETE